ncbi:hypothetical protein ACFWYW_30650 [Nonomuraea sp. NPDC059023]|uniref:hypothetical protein n=1 Tax=unclassified Nonomuraea TaxID=2593643 RepID=UPI0036BF1219
MEFTEQAKRGAGKMGQRAEFSAATRKVIAERAGYQCSVLNCGRLTVGPGPGRTQVANTGMAAHIYAASPDGPRGTGGLSTTERREPENGIWCCYSHGKEIDSDKGRAYSAAELKGWKRLHEARKSAEVNGSARDRYGLVESISVNSAPGALAGKKFDLAMRNIITGPNASGKSVLARLLASVADSDHVAKLSRSRDVDIEVRWFDPYAHDVSTTGRSGNVTHVLDGQLVPYVARPYKTILLDDDQVSVKPTNLVSLAQMLDLSVSAMKATLIMLAESSNLVREVRISGAQVDWTVEVDGRIDRSNFHGFSASMQSAILWEVVGFHARHHARVEPTLLLVDEGVGRHLTPGMVDCAIDRLQDMAEHAQVALISTFLPRSEISRGWMVTSLDDHRAADSGNPTCPIDFEIQTMPLATQPPM